MAIATITVKGQMTIPKVIREYLKLQPQDKVVLMPIDKGQVIMKSLKGGISDLKGAFKLPAWERKPLNFKKLRRAFEKGMTEQVIKEIR